MNNKWSIIFLILVLSFTKSFGQKFTGTVYEKDTLHPLVGVIVQHVKIDSISLIDYAITNNAGEWEMNHLNNTGLLKFSYLGFKTMYFSAEQSTVFNKVILQNNENSLDEILIKAEKVGVQVKGDTLIFDPEVFKRNDDKTLGDLLKRLPGIEIDGSNIKYNGGNISKLLLHRKDILSQKSLALDGINIEDIEDVELIKRYTENREKYDLIDVDKQVINVNIKSAALDNWVGNIEANAGLSDKYKLDANAFKVKEKIGTTLFGRMNSIGENLISQFEYLGSQTSSKRALASITDVNNILPTEFQIPPNLNKNHDAVISANLDWEINEKDRLKVVALTGLVNHFSNSKIDRVFFSDSTIVNSNLQHKNVSFFLNSGLNFQKELHKKIFLELDFPITYRRPTKTISQNGGGIGLNNLFDLENQDKQQYTSISPTLFLNYKIRDSLVLKSSFSYLFDNTKHQLSLASESNLFASGKKIGEQDLMIDNQSYLANIELQKRWNKWNYSLFLDFATIHQQLNQTYVLDEIRSNKVALSDRQMTIMSTQSYGLRGKNGWYIKASTGLSLLQRTLNSERKNNLNFLYQGILRYGIQKTHYAFLRVKKVQEPADLSFVNDLDLIQDAQNLIVGNKQLGNIVSKETYTLTYFKYNLLSKTLFHFLMNYTRQTNPFIIQTNTKENFIRQSYLQIPHPINTWNLSTLFSFNIKKAKIKLNYNYVNNKGFASVVEIVDSKQFVTNRISVSINSKNEIFNWDIKYAFTRNKLLLATTLLNTFDNHIPSLNLSYSKNKFLVKSSFAYPFNKTSNNSSDFFNLGFEANYELISNKFSIRFTGYNILNLDPSVVLTNTYRVAYFEVEQYDNFPGYLLLGASYRFQ